MSIPGTSPGEKTRQDTCQRGHEPDPGAKNQAPGKCHTPSSKHLLVYEPRTEGHHLGWLRFLTEDLLSANYRLSLAVDLRGDAKNKLQDHLADVLSEVSLLSAYDSSGRRHGDGRVGSVLTCLQASAAERVFLAAFDEIASSCWRRAAFGMNPPAQLHGRMGGIYHRPRFLVAPRWSPNRILKRIGFRRLLTRAWLGQLLLVDEFLTSDLQAEFPGAPVFFLPDPCPPGYDQDSTKARSQLQVPLDKRVFLFYGTGHRRKGLHLVVEAMLGLPPEEPVFLLCVGELKPEGQVAEGLEQLIEQRRARLIDRYVSIMEEKLSFAACDAVLLPYVNHFGTSGVLSRAMAAGKMVIASDQQLLGRLTSEHHLGQVFPSGNAVSLRERLKEAGRMSAEQLASWKPAACRYAQRYSREAFRKSLLASLEVSNPVVPNG